MPTFMFGRKTFIAAVCLYLLVIACTLWPSKSDSQTTDSSASSTPQLVGLDGLPYCGASMQLHNVNDVAGYEKSCDEIAALGGDSVMFVPSASMETPNSTRIYMDMRHTLSDGDLRALIRHAKADGLRVVLMPIVLLDRTFEPTDWRGTIKPWDEKQEDDWDDWFASYQDMILYYANLAQQTGVNVLVVGSELVSSEPFVDNWRSIIHKIRGVFHGQLTYSSNWDHYMMVDFWDDLDIVGMNSYWALGPDDDPQVPVSEIKRRWQKIQSDLFAWQVKTKKPIMLLEAGWCSLANASYAPWDYTQTQLDLDLDLQKRLYEGFFQSWWGQPQCGGFMMWEWTPESPGGPQDKGYTPRGKPAADVLKEWLAKPRWKVQ
jgi:GTA TIM-barrel-like domain